MADTHEMMDQDEQDDLDAPQSDISFPLGEGASARGRSLSDGDDDVEDDLYVPERRESLDLGLRSMDTVFWHMERAQSPVPSYTSMVESDSLDISDEVVEEIQLSTRVQLERTGSYSSSYSTDSDDCDKRTPKVRNKGDGTSKLPERPELIKDENQTRHPALTVGFTFKAISKTLGKLSEAELKYFKLTLWKRYPESFNTPPQGMDMVDLVDRLLERYDLEVALQLTKYLLKEMRLTKQVDYLLDLCTQNEVRCELRMNLKKRYSNVHEGSAMQGEQKAFDSVFTDLCLTSKGNFGPNIQHEVRQIQKINTHRKPEELIAIDAIFNADMIKDNYVKCLLTTGIAGMGKSMAVHKFIMDWVEERAHQNVYFLFPLPFRELNRFHEKEVSFLDILYHFFPETKKLKDFTCDEGRVLFICDGLDEYHKKPDFHRIESWTDEAASSSLHVLVPNLLKGNIFFCSLIWITSRPLRSHVLPAETVHQVMDGRGFNDIQKEEYFRKRFEDPVQADRVIAHLTSCKTLHIMCHIPLFCSVVCGAFQQAFREGGPEAELPKGLTKMYTQLLLVLLRLRSFRVPNRSQDMERDFLFKMGKMAFHMLEKGQVTISKETWKESGVEKEEAVVNTGLCTEFFVEKFIMYQERVQCFIHPTMQEYMAALYVYLSYRNHGKNVIEQQMRGKLSRIFKDRSMLDLYRSAVDRTVQSDGTYDLFLRFLLGMSLKTNQELLQPFFTPSEKWTSSTKETTALLRKRIHANDYPDRNANLLLSLEELEVEEASKKESVCTYSVKE